MNITPLQLIFIIATFVFILGAIDFYKRRKFNILHILIVLGGSGLLLLFIFNHEFLNRAGQYVGLERGADGLVYISIIVLAYLYLGIINKNIKQHIEQTNLARYITIQNRKGNLNPKTEIALIIPCYKNHATKTFIQKLLDQGYGIVFVDDGYNSKDLLTYVAELSSNHNIVLLSHPYNLGQGAALQTGQSYIYHHTTIPFAMHFDSDGQHRSEDISTFKKAFEHNPNLDIVIGSRFLGNTTTIPTWRKFHKKLQLLFTKLVIGLPLTDTHNGLRMIAHNALPKLTITLNDYTHASEIESLIKSQKLVWQEVPMEVIYEEHHLQGGQPLSNAFTIAKNIIYRLLFFR